MVIRVLVVDDSREVRALLRGYFATAADVSLVGEAADGARAIDLATALRPDVIVLDWQMPVLDGLSALSQLRRDAPDAGIIMFSSASQPGAAQRSLAAGADLYLEKGVDLGELLAAVRAVVDRGASIAGSRRGLP